MRLQECVAFLVGSLRSCAKQNDLEEGIQLHAYILRRRLLQENTIVLGNSLMDMYAKCGELSRARQVFSELPERNVVSWTVLITSYTQRGFAKEALKCFQCMKKEGILPNAMTYASILRAIGSIREAEKGEEIHCAIISQGIFLGRDIILGNALVCMYVKCGLMEMAQWVFYELPARNRESWNALIAGYSQDGTGGEEALDCFQQMQDDGIPPNDVTFICIVKACASIAAVEKGGEIHLEIVKRGFLPENIVLGNALIAMYVKFGVLQKAQEVFNELRFHDIVSWTSIIAGYNQSGDSEKGLDSLSRMQAESVHPDSMTLSCILKTCGSIGAIDKGKEVHAVIHPRGTLLLKNVVLGNALVSMYAKCGLFIEAHTIFDQLYVPSLVSWNVLIAGYCYMDRGEDALNSFKRMQCKYGLSPDAVTFASILKACGSICATQKGMKIHADIVKRGLLENNSVLGTALLDMYAKCGMVTEACRVFDELHCQNIVSWTALISGYSQIGNYAAVFNLFHKMIEEGLVPNYVTFIVMLNTCSYSGLDNEGEIYFDYITKVYGIIPTSEHYTCMVGLFGRMGRFDKAMESINKLPTFEHLPAWYALLKACQNWGNLNLGRVAFKQMH